MKKFLNKVKIYDIGDLALVNLKSNNKYEKLLKDNLKMNLKNNQN